jgi:hypothetical protein
MMRALGMPSQRVIEDKARSTIRGGTAEATKGCQSGQQVKFNRYINGEASSLWGVFITVFILNPEEENTQPLLLQLIQAFDSLSV